MYHQLWPSFVFLAFIMLLEAWRRERFPVVQQVDDTPARRRKKKRSR